MSERQIEELFAKRTRNSISRIYSPRQDLKFSQLKIYYEAVGREPSEQLIRNLELITEEDHYNYAAYLLTDVNNTSIKVAKYAGTDRVDLIENEEYGNCCLVKTTKQVLDKLDIENRTHAQITAKERVETRLLDPVALREAVINAIVHNDYTYEGVPKFELFSDRLEITSTGGTPQGLTKAEFFEGYSIPRNKELMRIFRDLDMVEYLGSGIPRIVKVYPKECFHFSDNFIRMVFPLAATTKSAGEASGKASPTTQKATPTAQKILDILTTSPTASRRQIAETLGDITEDGVKYHLEKLKQTGRIERVGPDKGGHWEVLDSTHER